MNRIFLLVLFAIGSLGCSGAKNSNPKAGESKKANSGLQPSDTDTNKGSSKAD